MSDVNANIGIQFDTANALAQLRQLQAGLSKFNQSLTEGNVAAANAQKGLNAQLVQSINATGKFVASQKTIASSTASFTEALEKNKLSMSEYFRFTGAAATMNSKSLKGFFSKEKEILTRASKDRVKALQTQYIQLTNAQGDLVKVLQVVPKHLKMVNGEYADYATRTQMAAQRQQFLNQLIKQGSTQLLNFGKNTQWAGRQLMVGFTIPLTMLGSAASKVFREMEMAVVGFTRVYGDMTTGMADTEKAVASIQQLAKEFTKFGIAATDTVNMAAKAAAMGLTGSALTAQVTAATKLAVLGQVEQQQALETTISLQNAFGISADQLAQKINFLNAVENQTVLSIEDLTIAIPKAGPVIKQLGGDVEDLAFFMTAMKEGGINASEGANALKSGLASLINPSKKASEVLAGFGINVKGIVDANAGDLKATVVGFARALDTLDPLNRARAIETMFGKFQFARLSTLFQNITKDSSQAARALGLAGASVEELAILSERELGKVENAVGVKFQKQLENVKLQLIPIGKAFLEAITPVVQFAGKILEKFNNLSAGTKKFVVGFIAILGGIAPVALMTVGLVANGVANLIKFFGMLRGGMAKLNGQNNVLGGGFDYLTQAEIDNLAQSQALHTSHQDLISTFNVEKASVDALAVAYQNAASQARALASGSPGLFNAVPGAQGAVSGLPKYAGGKKSDVVSVGGTGNQDTELALLTPGETVVSAPMSKKYGSLINAMIDDNVPGYKRSKRAKEVVDPLLNGKSPQSLQDIIDTLEVRRGVNIAEQPTSGAVQGGTFLDAAFSVDAMMAPGNTASGPGMDMGWLAESDEATASIVSALKVGQMRVEGASVSQENYAKFWADLTPELDELAGIFQSQARGAKDVDDAGKKAYPLIVQRIQEMEESGRLSAEDAAKLQLRTRALLAPTPEDRLAKRNRRFELAVDPETGGEKVKKVSWDGRATDEGPTYSSEPFQQAFPMELEKRGIPLPANYDKYQFAHVADRLEGETTTRPVTLRKYRDATGGTPGEVELARRAAAGEEIRPGDTVSSKEELDSWVREKIDLESQNELADAVDQQIENAKTKAKVKSPSERTRELGKNIADGLKVGMEEGEAGVRAQSDKLTDAAIPSAAQTQAKVDRMDLGNKAFYDDLKTPDTQDQRQVLKSIDRQNRKLGVGRNVVVPQDPVSGNVSPSSANISVTNNKTIINQAAEVAAKAQVDASNAEKVAADLRIKAAKWSEVAARESGKNAYTADNAKELEKRASQAEQRAAELRIKAAEEQARAASIAREDGSDGSIEAEVAKEKANEAEKKAAEARIKAAEAEQKAAEERKLRAEQGLETAEDPVKITESIKKEEELVANGTQEKGDLLRRSVAGSEDVADSTVLVADQTSDLADATQEALNTQLESNDNLVTSAELTDVTAANLGDVLQATDQTGLAQQDLAESSNEIAKTNDDILKLKQEQRDKLKKYNAEAAARAAAEGAIPEASQTNGKTGVPSTVLSSTDAYEEAMGWLPGTHGPDDPGSDGYTKDKKGRLLFDPETGQPTTLKEKALKQKARGLRREKVSKFSGKVSGGLGTAAMVSGMVGAPPQVTAALGGAATVAQFAPMIAGLGPIGMAVAGVAAVGVGLYAFNKHLQGSQDAQAKFVRETSASTKKMAEIGAITGKVGASEIMAKRRATGTSKDYIARERQGSQFGDTFLQSDVGKNMSKILQKNIEKSGAKEAVKVFGAELAAYVQDGVLTAEQAQSIAQQIGINFKDTKLGINVDAEISALIGPNGEDLKKDPIVVATRLVTTAENRSQRSLANMKAAQADGHWGSTEAADLAATDAAAVQMAQMQADAVAKKFDDEIRALETQLAQTKNKEKQVKLEKELSELKTKANTAEIQMNNLVADSVDNAVNRFKDNIQYETTYIDGLTLGLSKLWGGGNQREAGYMRGLSGAVTDKYANTEQATMAQTVQDRLAKYSDGGAFLGLGTDNYTEAGFAGGKEAQNFEVKMKLLMANGTLTPNQETALLDLFEGNLPMLETTLDIGTRLHGASQTAEMMMLLSGFGDKEYAQQIALEITTKDNDTYKKLVDMLGLAQMLDGREINMEVVLKEMGGVAGLEFYIKKFDDLEAKIKDLNGKPVTLETVAKFTDETGVGVDAGFIDYINKEFKGDAKQQTNAIRTYTTIYQQLMSMDYTSPEAREYFKSQAQTNVFDRLAQLQATGGAPTGAELTTWIKQQTELEIDAIITKVKVDPKAVASQEAITVIGQKPVIDAKTPGAGAGAGAGSGTNPLDFLDALAMRIKMVRDQAFNARKPLESMVKAFTSKEAQKDVANMFKLFKGLQQQLISLQAPKEFRDFIAGLSAEELDKLKNLKGKKALFTFGKDKNGKIDKNNITGFTQAGQAVMAAYREAPLNDFNIAQQEAIQNTNNQFKAFARLKAQGVDTDKALEMVSDSALAASLASKALSDTELKKYTTDINTANSALEKQAVITDLIKKNSDFEFKTEAMPKLASAMNMASFSADQIKAVLSDPNLAKQLMDDLADGKVDSKAISEYLKSIEDQKILDLQISFNAGDFAASARPGMELVNKMFSTQEQLIRTGINKVSNGNTEDVVAELKSIKAQNEKDQLAIQKIQVETLKPLENKIADAQRYLETQISRKIEEYQKQIDSVQRSIELAFERPIKAIQDRNALISHDLEVMSHAAEQINEKYDKQVEALDAVEKANQRILRQQQQQLGLADALSSGDIAAAARAAQEMRAANADDLATATRDSLDAARKTEIDSLTGVSSGLTRKQIEEEQYQNAQKIYALENTATTNYNGQLLTRVQLLERVQGIQDAIYAKEQERLAKQAEITSLEDQVYNVNKDQIKPLQDAMDVRNLAAANYEADLQRAIDTIQVLGQTKDVWDGITAKIDASEFAGQEFDKTMGIMLASVDAIDGIWEDVLFKLNSVSDVTQEISDASADMFATAGANDLDARELADKAQADYATKYANYETQKAEYDKDFALMNSIKASGGGLEGATAIAGFNAKWKNGAPVAPTPPEPSSAADNPNVSYNNPSVNSADKYISANANKAAAKPAGGTGGSGGGSGSGGNSGTKTDPTPTPTKPGAVTGTTGTGSATVSALAEDKIFDVREIKKITTGANRDFTAATAAGQTAAVSKIQTDIRNIQLQIDKDFPNRYSATDHINATLTTAEADKTEYTRMLAKTTDVKQKAELRVELDKIMALKDEMRKYFYGKDSTGKVVRSSDTVKSEKMAQAQLDATKQMPAEVKELLDMLKNRSETFKADKKEYDVKQKSYRAKANDRGYTQDLDKIPMGDIKKDDPDTYKVLFPLSQEYAKAKSTMEWRELAMNKARTLLTDAGYTKDKTSWYFGDDTTYMTRTNNGSDYSKWKGYATGGLVSSRFAQKEFKMGTDTVPAMLTPGEFVMTKYAVKNTGVDNLRAINNGASVGDSVYNYNLSVNVRSDANPDEIARSVMAQIKQIDSQRIRGVRV